MIESLPKKYKTFVTTAIKYDCVDIFEKPKKGRSGKIKAESIHKMASILGISERTVRRYADTAKQLLYEKGKKRFLNKI